MNDNRIQIWGKQDVENGNRRDASWGWIITTSKHVCWLTLFVVTVASSHWIGASKHFSLYPLERSPSVQWLVPPAPTSETDWSEEESVRVRASYNVSILYNYEHKSQFLTLEINSLTKQELSNVSQYISGWSLISCHGKDSVVIRCGYVLWFDQSPKLRSCDNNWANSFCWLRICDAVKS